MKRGPVLNPKNIDEVWVELQSRLQRPRCDEEYETESDFEVEVWKRVVRLASDLGLDPGTTCLTSHAIHTDRSAVAWDAFLKEDAGPDVNALGSKNRLDIVLRHPKHGSIGIEVKCLGQREHAGKLTQAIGQALLGLWHRHRTVVVIHCGTVDANVREDLRTVGKKICDGARIALVVVP